MSRDEYHARKAVIDEVLELAATDPIGALRVHGVDSLFGGPEGLLRALQYRWTNHLDAKLDYALETGADPADAWAELAAEQPVLRALLDDHRTRLPIAA